MKNQEGVEDISINSIDYTLYASEFVSSNSKIELMTSGTDVNTIALEMPFNSIVATENSAYDGVNAYLDVANTPIDTRINPVVNKAVLGYDNTYRPSPLNRTDFFLSTTTTRISYDPSLDTIDPVVSGEQLFFNYNYYEQSTVDGFRVFLGGDNGMIVRGSVYTGSTEPISQVSGTQVDVTLDGSEKLYEFKFPAPVTLSPETNNYWIVLTSNVAGNTGTSYLPTDNNFVYTPFNSRVLANSGSGYVRQYEIATYESFYNIPSSQVYSRIKLSNASLEPEKSRYRSATFTFKESVDT